MTPEAHAALAWMRARGARLCAFCRHYDPEAAELDSGVRYCRRYCTWQWPGGGQACPCHEPSTGDDHATETT